jgi:hypothetical protein
MPNNSDARRSKREKKKKGRGESSPSPPQQVIEENVESFLSRSATDSGLQGEDDEVMWDSAAGEAVWDNSLSLLHRETVKEAKKRARKEARAKEFENVSDDDLADEEGSKAKDPSPRKTSLSPTQFLESKAQGPLTGTGGMQRRAMERLSSRAAPIQDSEAKGMDSVSVEAIAVEVSSGVNKTQKDNQGTPQGSLSVSFPSPTFNMLSTEHAQALQRNLAAELILAGTGTSPLISPARHSQEPGTAITMIANNAARRNNPNPSAQVPEAGKARVEAQAQQADQPRIELARGQSGVANARRGQAATPFKTAFTQGAIEGQDQMNARVLQSLEEDRVRQKRLRGAAAPLQVEPEATTIAARTASMASDTTAAITPVMGMRFCIEHLEVIRNEAGNSPLSDFSDYWAPDHSKTTPNLPNTFVPLRMLKGSSPLWRPFYNSGQVTRDSGGAPEPDPNHPPYFRVSAELLGRMLHTFKRQYVEDDLNRKTCDIFTSHITAKTELARARVSQAAQDIRDNRDSIIGEHNRMIEASHANLMEASKVFKETVDKHVAALQTTVQGGASIAQNFAVEADKARRTILSARASPSLQLDSKELGFVKQLKELQEAHHKLLSQHELLQATKSRIVEQLNSAREANKGASLVTANLEEKVRTLEQDKFVLELKQIKLKGEMETLKRKRRSTPSPPPAKPQPRPNLGFCKGAKRNRQRKRNLLFLLLLTPQQKGIRTGLKDGTSRHQDWIGRCQVPHTLPTT